MKDRIPTYPGRVLLTPVPGQPNKYDMVRADEPTDEGTPLNKATFLKDSTAALYGEGVETPDEVFAELSGAFIGSPTMEKIAEFNSVSISTTPVSLSLSGIDLSKYKMLRMVTKLSVSSPLTDGIGAIQAGINNVSTSIFYNNNFTAETDYASSQASSPYFRLFTYVFGGGVSILNMFMVNGLPVMILRSAVSKFSNAQNTGVTPLYAHALCADYNTPLASIQISAEIELMDGKGVALDIVLYGG